MMKKTLKSLAMLALAALAVSSCQKENLRENEVTPVPGKQIEVTVNGLMGEYQVADATKADLVNTVRVAWTGGEQVYAYTTSGLLGTLTASLEGTEDRYAKLSGTLSDPGDKTVTLVYSPQFTEAPSLNEAKISLDLSEQDGAKVPFVVYGTLDSKDLTVSNAIVPFKFATSVMKVNCTGLSEEEDITKAEVSNVNTVCEITFKDAAAPDIAGKTLGTITRKGTGAFCSADSRAIFQLAIVATEAAQPSERVLTISQDKDYVADFSACALASGKSYNSVYAMSKVTFKAVYNTNGGADTLTFYFDANDHSGEGITVYDNLPAAATTYTSWGYNGIRGNIKSVKIDPSVAGYKGLTSTACMFFNMTEAESISGAEYLDVSNVKDMTYMFCSYGRNSTSLTAVPDVSGWKTDNVEKMGNLFSSYGQNSTSLTAPPDVSKWNTGNVTDMGNMFSGYGQNSTSLTAVPDVSGWKTDNVTNMGTLFAKYGDANKNNINCVLDLTGWNLANLATGNNVFYNFSPNTFKVTIPAKTGENANLPSKWYGSGTFSFAPPEGKTFTPALAGVFSVSATKKVHFSKGNLWYGKVGDAQTATFHFEERQCDSTPDSGDEWVENHISHFYWSKDRDVATAEEYDDSSDSEDDIFFTNEDETTANSEFTVFVGEDDEEGQTGVWRTLSTAEWQYLFSYGDYKNDTRSNKCKWATVDGVEGYVLAPDNFSGQLQDNYASNEALANENLVFLPAAGIRSAYYVSLVSKDGYYWSSTAYDEQEAKPMYYHAHYVVFDSYVVYPYLNGGRRSGFSVRLVTDVPAE